MVLYQHTVSVPILFNSYVEFHWVDVPFLFKEFPVDELLDCFQTFVIINSAKMYISLTDVGNS